MVPFWPFKKKQTIDELDEDAPAPMVYKRGEDPHAQPAEETDQSAYKDALALFGGGSDHVEAASDQSTRYDGAISNSDSGAVTKPEPTPVDVEESVAESKFTWVHHTDGYHYKQLEDGSFEPTAHVQNQDGTYEPYS
jgi:hypothetical protein